MDPASAACKWGAESLMLGTEPTRASPPPGFPRAGISVAPIDRTSSCGSLVSASSPPLAGFAPGFARASPIPSRVTLEETPVLPLGRDSPGTAAPSPSRGALYRDLERCTCSPDHG